MGVGWTSIGELSEVWVGGHGSASDWGEDLRTTGTGPHTTLDLTHVRNSLGRSGVKCGGVYYLLKKKSNLDCCKVVK